jgi:hypothetical protein
VFAIIAAIVFLILLLLDLFDQLGKNDLLDWQTLAALGLFFMALHMTGYGATYHTRIRSRRRR